MQEEEMKKLVEMIMVLDGQDRYQQVLQIWSTFITMVFDEQRTKAGQISAIQAALTEHENKVKDRADKIPTENADLKDAGELMAMQFIHSTVCKAFEFSTYSAQKRCTYICGALQDEIDSVNAEINPLRHILNKFRNT